MVSQGGDLATIPNMKINDHLSSIAKVNFYNTGFRDFWMHFFSWASFLSLIQWYAIILLIVPTASPENISTFSINLLLVAGINFVNDRLVAVVSPVLFDCYCFGSSWHRRKFFSRFHDTIATSLWPYTVSKTYISHSRPDSILKIVKISLHTLFFTWSRWHLTPVSEDKPKACSISKFKWMKI